MSNQDNTIQTPYRTVKGIANHLNLSERMIHKMKERGDLPFYRLGGRIMFKIDEVEEALKTLRQASLAERVEAMEV